MELYGVLIGSRMEESRFHKLLSFCDDKKRSVIQRYVKWEDAQRALTGEILVRAIICSRLHIENHNIVLEKDQYGKPYLKNAEGFHFNISHSGKWVVCAVDRTPVGIDIEEVKSIDLDIAESFFSKEEYQDLMAKPRKERLTYFYDLWTLKESYIKAVGMGLAIPLNCFSIHVKGENTIEIRTTRVLKEYYFRQYHIDSGYKLSVCAGSDNFPACIKKVDLERLCSAPGFDKV